MFKRFLILVIVLAVLGAVYTQRHLLLPEDNKNELVFWTIQLKPVCEKIIQRNINEFERTHKDIKITWVDIPIAEAQKRTLASILGNNPPDLVNLNPDFSMLLAERGALQTFTPRELEDFHPELVKALKFNGRIFGVPYYATSSVTLYNKAAYNKCIVQDEENPVSFPKTYDELEKLAPKLQGCTPNSGSVFTVNLNENDTLARILSKYDISNFNSPYSVHEVTKVFDMFKRMYNSGYLPKDSLTINHREVIEKYMSPSTMFVVTGANFINMVKENAQDVYNNSAVAPQLTGLNGKYDVALMNFIIPKKSKHKALAKEFVLQLTSPENQLEFARLTNVLPANVLALENDYFNLCDPADLIAQARCESKRQLDNLIDINFGYKNKKAINDTINRAFEGYILENSGAKGIEALAQEVKLLQN